MTDFKVIIKKKTTFDVVEYPFVTSLSMSGTSYVVTYYSDAGHTGAAASATYTSADYIVYVVPKE